MADKKNKTPDYVHGKFMLATTDVTEMISDDASYKEFLTGCTDTEKPGRESQEFLNWCMEETDINWETDLNNIKEEPRYCVPCILTGQLGLWNGRPTIVPEKFNSVHDALKKIIHNGSGSAYCDFDIYFNDGHIEVSHHHHDGTNSFEIHALSKKGIAKCTSAEERYEDIPELKIHDTKRLPYLYA